MIKFSLQMYAAIFLSHNIPLILLLNVQVDGNKLVVSYGYSDHQGATFLLAFC